ncbi:MAG: PIG-L deacetylase family protein [Clostridia bacterium]
MKKHLVVLLVTLLLAALPIFALAQTAEDFTPSCKFKASANAGKLKNLRDGKYTTSWRANASLKAYVEIHAPKGQTIGGVYVKWYNEAPKWRVTVKRGDRWEDVALSETGFLAEYLPVPGDAASVRICPAEGEKSNLRMSELRVYGAGDPPPDVQRWNPVPSKCDLLVIAAHPDDELLFMGGTIPYYAGELGKSVEVLYLVPSSVERRLELLDGLWLCGAKNYPIYGVMRDNFAMSLKVMYRKWSKNKLDNLVVGAIRQCRPDVIVTHDVKGEYGHGAHRAAADASKRCITDAANPKKYPKSEALYGTWQVSKLYLHLYDKNQITMDWRVPLSAFDGKTAFDMAQAGFRLHLSQQDTEYVVRDDGPYDNRKFGLYYTSVGEDVLKNDFLENVNGAQ